jgi:hypothetical protein
MTISYRSCRFPSEVIQHCVWLYLGFTLSFRDLEDLLAERASSSPAKPSGGGATASARRAAHRAGITRAGFTR